MNQEDVEKFIDQDDIKQIAQDSGVSVVTVRKVLKGEFKRSRCKKFILKRIEENKKFINS